jgi:hypothetical protein
MAFSNRDKLLAQKKLLLFLVVGFLILAVFHLGFLIFSLFLDPCKDNRWPIPSPGIVGFGPFNLITDQGNLFIGQTYEHRNEGPWVGNMTLLSINSTSAILMFEYPTKSEDNFEIKSCKGFLLRTNE